MIKKMENGKPFSKTNFPNLVKTGFGHVILAIMTLNIVIYPSQENNYVQNCITLIIKSS